MGEEIKVGNEEGEVMSHCKHLSTDDHCNHEHGPKFGCWGESHSLCAYYETSILSDIIREELIDANKAGMNRIDVISQNGNTGEHYDVVKKPSHYQTFPDQQAIDIIKATLTEEEFKGYCKGNFLKYRLRAGFKGDTVEDIDKSQVYRDWLFDLEQKGKE